jgi:hypothetical protein
MPGCGRRNTVADYTQTVRSAATNVPVALEMERQFGDADHFITEYGFDDDPKQWNTEVFFGGRYILTMQVMVKVDYSMNSVTQLGEPTFYLFECETISVEPNGRLRVHHDPDGQVAFGNDEWSTLRDSGGDFARIGVAIHPEPVKNFDIYVAGQRAPRVRVRLSSVE